MNLLGKKRKQYICSCFYTDNYYSKIVDKHFSFADKHDFIQKNKQMFNDQPEVFEALVNELVSEQERRKNLANESLQRKSQIASDYKPLHPDVYALKESYLDERFLGLVEACRKDTVPALQDLPIIQSMKADRVFSFPVFTKEFCDMLIEELSHFEKSSLPKGRPNTMNKYGILLDELGLDVRLINPLKEHYLAPIAKTLFEDWGGGSLDSHKAFTVMYEAEDGKDLDLGYHYDNAEVTINVSLGKDYEEGALYFGPMRHEQKANQVFAECRHKVGYGILHRGQHMHGAMPISEGLRHNLIIWMRSSAIRNKLCPMCDCVPTLVETEGPGDGFTQQTVEVCALT